MNIDSLRGQLVVEDRVLDGADFSRRCLIAVVFRRCRIRFASFQGCELSYAEFHDCDLYQSTFFGSVLYTTRFRGCDLTKAVFDDAYLNGLRVADTDITHTSFGDEFEVGKNRKPIEPAAAAAAFLTVRTFEPMPVDAPAVEKKYPGVACPDAGRAIEFFNDPVDEEWRGWRRRSEVAKTVERLMIENGYRDRSLSVYYRYRCYLTRSEVAHLKRWSLLLFVEFMWGYGIKLGRPVATWFLLIAVFALVYGALPAFDAQSGLMLPGRSDPVALVIGGQLEVRTLLESLYFSGQVSTLSVYGDAKPAGLARGIAVLQQVISVLGVGLGTAVLTRRIGNV